MQSGADLLRYGLAGGLLIVGGIVLALYSRKRKG